MTQEALAEKVGISVRYTQSIEAGEYWPALPTLLKLRKALGASWTRCSGVVGSSPSGPPLIAGPDMPGFRCSDNPA